MKRALVSLFFCFVFHSSFSQSWQPVGGGVNNVSVASAVYKSKLYIGGVFTMADGMPVNYIARWDGSKWDSVGSGVKDTGVLCLAVFDSVLYAGGQFATAGKYGVRDVAQWNGTNWDSVGHGITTTHGWAVEKMAIFNRNLYATGNFTTIQKDGIFKFIVKWDGTKWDSVGIAPNNMVWTLTEYNNKLVAGGYFDSAGGLSAKHIANWDGTKWDSLGSGLDNIVFSLAAYKGELYAGGVFTHAGGIPVNYIARWDGAKWDSVGSGVSGGFTCIYAMTVFNGYLYVGGDFTTAGGIHASEIARWDGSKWDSVGIGLTGGINGIRTLAVYDSTLYAGGDFSSSGSTVLNNIAMFCDTCKPMSLAQVKNNNNELRVYPNPSNGVFTLTLTAHEYTPHIHVPLGEGTTIVQIYNMMGEKIYVSSFGGGVRRTEEEIDLSNQPAGIYMYRVITETGKLVGEGKIVIE